MGSRENVRAPVRSITSRALRFPETSRDDTLRIMRHLHLFLLSFPALLASCTEGVGNLPDPRTTTVEESEGETGAGTQQAIPPNTSLADAWLDSLLVTTAPDSIRQGSIFRIFVEAPGPGAVLLEGTFAGEPLHFESDGEGRFEALAAAPVDASGEMDLTIRAALTPGAEPSEATHSLMVHPGDYRLERLTVAPGFTEYPPEIAERISSESARAMAVSRASHATPRLWSAPFEHPRPDRITSGFGHGRTFNGVVQSRHMGTDFAGAVGAPVTAPARGIVALSDTFYLGGNVLYLDHGDGLVTAYLHLSEQLVSAGDTVETGDVIARVGATGRVTGPHLHWIVRYGEITVDGLSLLEFR